MTTPAPRRSLAAQAFDALPPRARMQIADAYEATEFCIARALRTSKTAVINERQFWGEIEDLQKRKSRGEETS